MAGHSRFLSLWRDRTGVAAAEYALLLAIIGGSVAMAAWMLGQAIDGSVSNSATLIASYTGAGST
ncbi:MAG TPA: Flp family type IVb pilin, partial [Sphingobium sp.]|nr:Flp family type IVb pilin [Sphingobium sp.]